MHLLLFHADAADRTHATFTSDIDWPATRTTARLTPGSPQTPVLMPSKHFDASTQRFTLIRLPDPHLKPTHEHLFFEHAHHDGLQSTQHKAV